jgi:hypothetical protein
MHDLLHYEICAAWWPQFVSWGPLQDIIAGHFARKVAKKYRRWKWCVERSQRLSDLIPPNVKGHASPEHAPKINQTASSASHAPSCSLSS